VASGGCFRTSLRRFNVRTQIKVLVVGFEGGDMEFVGDQVGIQGEILVINQGLTKQVLVKEWYQAYVERVEVDVVEGEAHEVEQEHEQEVD